MFTNIKRLFCLVGNHGLSDELICAHRQITSTLPKVLYHYYQELGAHQGLNHAQNDLLAPHQLCVSKDGAYLVFYVENQQVCVWGIQMAHLTFDDSPVYVSGDKTWQKEHDTLSDFLYVMANLQAVFGLPYALEDFMPIGSTQKTQIAQRFKKRGAFTHWLGIEFFGNRDDDVIAVIKNQSGDLAHNDDLTHSDDLTYSSAQKAQFDELDEFFTSLPTHHHPW